MYCEFLHDFEYCSNSGLFILYMFLISGIKIVIAINKKCKLDKDVHEN